jgi:uncharacterized protein YegL
VSLKFVCDGSNLAFSHKESSGRKIYDLRRLELAVKHIQEACQPEDCVVKVFADASLRYGLLGEQLKTYQEMVRSGFLEVVPAGIQADRFILNWADANDGFIVTNDGYRDYAELYPWVAEVGVGRLVSGLFDKDLLSWAFFEKNAGLNPARDIRTLALKASSNKKVAPLVVKIPVMEAINDEGRPAYRFRVTSGNPMGFIFLIDQSDSMNDSWTKEFLKKDKVAEIVNQVIHNLVLAATKGKPDPVHYFDIAILGYSGPAQDGVRTLIEGTTLENPFLSITELYKKRKEAVVEIGGLRKIRPTWIGPVASGATPMCKALKVAENALKKWLDDHESSFPPIVFNITDGESTDGDPLIAASSLCEGKTKDGNTMLWTAHISTESNLTIRYPNYLSAEQEATLRQMFNMSSLVPTSMRLRGRAMGIDIPEGGRAFLYNADATDVVQLLDIGTQGTVIEN